MGDAMYTFSSKKDWWVVAFIICMSGLLIQLLLTMQAKGTMQQYPVHAAVYILTVLLLWWPILNTRYIVKNDELTIHSLLFKWVIPIADIQKVSLTDHLDASPALSLKRVKIEYLQDGEMKQILVSPRDQQGFLKALGMHK